VPLKCQVQYIITYLPICNIGAHESTVSVGTFLVYMYTEWSVCVHVCGCVYVGACMHM